MTDIIFPGRLLFLCDDDARIRAQIAGEDLTLEQARPLRDDISTDEMTSQLVVARYQPDFGPGLLTQFRAGDALPIGEYVLQDYGISAIVAGRRYGKGSAREHSPIAHRSAGVRLIIAESFERIFRQNCDNLGIFTSTDFGLIDRLRDGAAISVDELIADRKPLEAALLRSGGLLAYGAKHIMPVADHIAPPVSEPSRPATLTEKILMRHLGAEEPPAPGDAVFARADWRFCYEYYTSMIAHYLHDSFGNPAPLKQKESILLFQDHLTFAHRSRLHIEHGLVGSLEQLSRDHEQFARDYGVVNHGRVPGQEGSEGICHALMLENYALPGQIVVGTDSHTPHSGALGCLAFGVGSTDMALSFVTGMTRITTPATILIRLSGHLRPGVTAKDVVLHLLAQEEIKAGGGVGMVFEYAGPVVDAMSIDERATLTNMTAEAGGFSGICAPDAETARFLKERRGVDFVIEPWMRSDPDARYAAIHDIDCIALGPQVALPGDPGNVVPIVDLPGEVAVHIAYGGSCTAGKREDFDAYHEVFRWGADHGLTVPEHVKLYLQFGTLAVRDYCRERGYLDTFAEVGAEMLMPSCGACAGCGPGSSETADQVTVSSINRNFPGRSGPGKVWLASPATVAASALAGKLVSFEDLKRSI